MVPPRLIVVPLKVIDPTFTVLEKVVVPVAAFVWVKAPVMLIVLEKRRAAEWVMVRAVNAVASPEPTTPVKLTAPVVFTMRVSAEPPAVPLVAPAIKMFRLMIEWLKMLLQLQEPLL